MNTDIVYSRDSISFFPLLLLHFLSGLWQRWENERDRNVTSQIVIKESVSGDITWSAMEFARATRSTDDWHDGPWSYAMEVTYPLVTYLGENVIAEAAGEIFSLC